MVRSVTGVVPTACPSTSTRAPEGAARSNARTSGARSWRRVASSLRRRRLRCGLTRSPRCLGRRRRGQRRTGGGRGHRRGGRNRSGTTIARRGKVSDCQSKREGDGQHSEHQDEVLPEQRHDRLSGRLIRIRGEHRDRRLTNVRCGSQDRNENPVERFRLTHRIRNRRRLLLRGRHDRRLMQYHGSGPGVEHRRRNGQGHGHWSHGLRRDHDFGRRPRRARHFGCVRRALGTTRRDDLVFLEERRQRRARRLGRLGSQLDRQFGLGRWHDPVRANRPTGSRGVDLRTDLERFAGERVLQGRGKGQGRRVAVCGRRAQDARKHLGERCGIGGLDRGRIDRHRVTRGNRAPAGDELERDARQRKDIRREGDRTAGHPLRGGIRSARLRAEPHTLEGGHHPEAGEAHLVRRHQHIARMQRPVVHADSSRGVERAGQLPDQAQSIWQRRRAVLLQRHVGRVGDEIFFDHVRGGAVGTRAEREDDERVRDLDQGQPLEVGGEIRRLFGSQVEGERLDRHDAVLVGVVATEHRTQDADANLVYDAISAEGRRR